MTAPVRRAGRLAESGGSVTTWSVAEGRRGRRWRWVTSSATGADVAHTVETDREGAFVRLESAAGGALLTLHREVDGSLHGNRVTPNGIDHLSVLAPAPPVVVVGPGRLGLAVLVGLIRAGRGGDTGTLLVDSVVISDALDVRRAPVELTEEGRGAWTVAIDGARVRLELDADGLPWGEDGGADDRSWPLEVDG